MLKKDSLNIPATVIKCSCGNETTKQFNNISDFAFNIQSNVRSFGIKCEKCDKFIPITSFLKNEDVVQIMNNFMDKMCNL